jgi:death-on-curing protein
LPVWLEKREVLYFYSELLGEHGGLAGPPNEDAIESTLARPRNRLGYEPHCSIYRLAAAYGFGFSQNHCFPDGNKRLALVAIDVFLQANGYELQVDEAEAVVVIRGVAAGELTEQELAAWVESHSVSVE